MDFRTEINDPMRILYFWTNFEHLDFSFLFSFPIDQSEDQIRNFKVSLLEEKK